MARAKKMPIYYGHSVPYDELHGYFTISPPGMQVIIF
jgi:hypothetical protein